MAVRDAVHALIVHNDGPCCWEICFWRRAGAGSSGAGRLWPEEPIKWQARLVMNLPEP